MGTNCFYSFVITYCITMVKLLYIIVVEKKNVN